MMSERTSSTPMNTTHQFFYKLFMAYRKKEGPSSSDDEPVTFSHAMPQLPPPLPCCDATLSLPSFRRERRHSVQRCSRPRLPVCLCRAPQISRPVSSLEINP